MSEKPINGAVLALWIVAISLGCYGSAGAEEVRRKATSPTASRVTGPAQHLRQVVAGEGATMIFRIVPVADHPAGPYAHGGAYSAADINGETLTIHSGGFRSYWNVQILDWDPDYDPQNGPESGFGVTGWQARMLASGYANGVGGDLTPPSVPCMTAATDCANTFGEPASPGGGSVCNNGTCQYAWINRNRPDAFRSEFEDCGFVHGLSITSPLGPLFYGNAGPEPCELQDPHEPVFLGAFALDVPADADGEYVIPFEPTETIATHVATYHPIAALLPGRLVISPCQGNSDCVSDLCSTGVCVDGRCQSSPKPGWDPQTQCCDPQTGMVVGLNSMQCKPAWCSLGFGKGTRISVNRPDGTACATGDPCAANEACTAGKCTGLESPGPGCPKARYISLEPADLGGPTAIRVWLTSLHHPQPNYDNGVAADFTAFEGEARWVGPVSDCVDSQLLGTTFKCAKLQCAPHYADWMVELSGAPLHVTGDAVVPSSEFDIEQLQLSCQGNEDVCGDVHIEPSVITGRWCDSKPPYQDTAAQYQSQPNVLDIESIVDTLLDEPTALMKVRVQFNENDPDPAASVTVIDLSRVVDVIKGGGYPFAGPSPCDP